MPPRWGSRAQSLVFLGKLTLFVLLVGLGAGCMAGFVLGLGDQECSDDVPHHRFEASDHSLGAVFGVVVEAPPPGISGVQGLVDDRAGLGGVSLVSIDPDRVVAKVGVATESFGPSGTIVPVGLVASPYNLRAGPTSSTFDFFGEGNLHLASPPTWYRPTVPSLKGLLPISPLMQAYAGERAAEGRPVPRRLIFPILFAVVLLLAAGLWGAVHLFRALVGCLMDLWGMEC